MPVASPGSTPAVEVDGLVKTYAGRRVVDGLSLRAAAGQVTAVLGPNGAGKTTTVETCEGLRTADAGTVRVLGLDPRRDAAALRPRVGVMLQDGGLPMPARALELVEHVARLHARPLDVAELAARLGIDGFARTTVRRLSGGQRQRVALAAALVGRPEVLFLDEPGAGLDPQARQVVHEVVTQARDSGVAVVLTTHSMEEAERLADQVVIVDAGRVVAHGTPDELRASGAQDTIRFTARPVLDLTPLRAALPAGVHVAEQHPGRYLLAGDVTPQVLATLTAWCASQDVMPEGLSVARRSLEDVFLELTGRELR